MPLPLAPLLPLAIRLGLVATTTLAVARWVRSGTHPGRTDQRAEDALDNLGEGFSLHRPADRATDHPWHRQTNATARIRRVIRLRGRSYEIDGGLMARLRLRRTGE
ncbi:hypothetical protein [Rhodobacter calidifons]|uniref:Uncharacterized protein n=1 Tax=Rhodobacter calidifons TaxID=2715277 RepID=A0ABX0G6U0_9RHOB|nr:hypothetical protein [Rhodobacter calidifons]NHB76574.1 hypothetical protein [Rhodobacter calidifons]